MGFVDLHVHSNASDGSFSPSEVVSLAARAGLCAIALTDHDTVDGIGQAETAAKTEGIRLIPGIEISSMYEGTEIHILGLFVQPEEPSLAGILEKFRAIRDNRNRLMLERLAADGMTFKDGQLTGGNPDTVITRAHVARALVEAGYASSLDQAFKRFLKYGGKYCPYKESPPPETAVEALLKNGAFVSLAHPYQYKLGDAGIRRLAARMKEMGMQGLEVYHSSHNQYESGKLQVLAKELGLLPTGGSDFHGAGKPDISIGTGRGGLRVSSLLLDDIDRSRGGATAR